MQKIFQYDNVKCQVELNIPEILLIREFAALLDEKRNICKTDKTGKLKLRAFREFTYMWLAIDWNSIYRDYLEYDRHVESLKDSRLADEEYNDPIFREACRKYVSIQESTRSIRMLKAAQSTIDKFIIYFETVNPTERDDNTGKPIFKVKDIMAEIGSLSKVNDELKILEGQVKKEISEQSTLRAGATEGYMPKGL